MKQLISLFAVAAVVLAAPMASAATFKTGDQYALSQGQSVESDLYAASGNIVIDGNLGGDLLATGGDISISGTVAEDAMIAGGKVRVTGVILDDLRVAGGTVEIEGEIGDDVIVAGGEVRILPGATVGGSVIVAGGNVIIEGAVAGGIRAIAGELEIHGTVGGAVTATAKRILIGNEAVLEGAFSYRSEKEAVVMSGAQVAGPISFKQAPNTNVNKAAFVVFLGALAALWVVLKIVMHIAVVLVIALLFPRLVQRITKDAAANPGTVTLTGFLMLIAVPLAVLASLLTIVTAPLGIVVGFAYMAWLILSSAIGTLMLGSWLHRWASKKTDFVVNWKTALIGVLGIAVLSLIPVIGWLARLLIILVAFGGFGRLWRELVWRNR